MEKNDATLALDALTPSRQTMLTDALTGHNVELASGHFTEASRESLAKVGLSQIEITALEQINLSNGTNASLKVPDSTIPSSTNNPFSKNKWNPERQRQLHDSDPILARTLMREAGLLG